MSQSSLEHSTLKPSELAETIAPSPTLAIDGMAKRMAAEGRDIVNLSAGEPDLPPPGWALEKAREHLGEPSTHRYSATAGLPLLRRLVAQAVSDYTGISWGPDNVVITNGGKAAAYLATLALADPGASALLIAPYWTSYTEIIRMARARPVELPTDIGNGFRPEPAALADALRGTRLLILNHPANPTGTVFGPSELAAIAEAVRSSDAALVSDDIYQHLVYPPARFTSILAVASDLAERTVIVSGASKSYSLTGWRVGWIVAPREIAQAAEKLQSQICSNVCNLAQLLAASCLEAPPSFYAERLEVFRRRRDLIVGMLSEIDGLEVREPEGAFYVFPRVEHLIEQAGSRFSSSYEMAEFLLREVGVAVVPGEAFGAPGHLRFSYATSEDRIREGVQRIRGVLSS
jgi:aspartate aminotransferase